MEIAATFIIISANIHIKYLESTLQRIINLYSNKYIEPNITT